MMRTWRIDAPAEEQLAACRERMLMWHKAYYDLVDARRNLPDYPWLASMGVDMRITDFELGGETDFDRPLARAATRTFGDTRTMRDYSCSVSRQWTEPLCASEWRKGWYDYHLHIHRRANGELERVGKAAFLPRRLNRLCEVYDEWREGKPVLNPCYYAFWPAVRIEVMEHAAHRVSME